MTGCTSPPPNIGVETAIQDVVYAIKYSDLDDFVLVGHSLAGMVAATAYRVSDRVKMVVYLDAARPEKVRAPQLSFDPTARFGPLPPGGFALTLSEKIFDAIGRDVGGGDREWMLAKCTAWPIRYGLDPAALSEKFGRVACAHIFCTHSSEPVDETLRGEWAKLDGPYCLVDSGHWPTVPRPGEAVEALFGLAS